MGTIETMETTETTEGYTRSTDKRAHAIRRELGARTTFYTGPVHGETWITESHWAMPLGRFGALFDGDPGPGAWITASNDKGPACSKTGTPPNLAAVAPAPVFDESKAMDLERVTVEGVEVFLKDSAPLFRLPAGELVGVNQDYLAALVPNIGEYIGGHTVPAPRITAARGATPTSPLSIWRATSHTTVDHKTTPSWTFVGIMMPIRVDKKNR
jgi:hypothetical protein